MLGLRDLMEIAALDVPELHDPPHAPGRPPATCSTDAQHLPRHPRRRARSCCTTRTSRSSTSVERFLREASERPEGPRDQDDALPHVARLERHRAPHATRRATASRSRSCVELKARFDEAANIQWASRLERAGIHVTYGVVGLKTHCKMILVVRQDYDGLRRYAHIGTGNYHAGTARLYTDLGLLTCDDGIGQRPHRAVQLPDHRLQAARASTASCWSAPTHAQAGAAREDRARDRARRRPARRASSRWKMNALEDVDIVARAVPRLAGAACTIDLIVRDTCRLRPGPARPVRERPRGQHRRPLPRARAASTTSATAASAEYYIGSADCMKRNLESRVEVLVPVEDPRAAAASCAASSTPSSATSAAPGTCSPTAATSQRNGGLGAKHASSS